MRTFLSGPMGSGKSTLGRRLAQSSGRPFIDLDALIETQEGAPVSRIFERRGEAAFRALEAEAFAGVLAEHPHCVVSLGGGTLTNRALRHEALRSGVVLTLDADVEVLAERVGSGQGRPLLAGGGDVTKHLAALREQRAAAYAECHARIDTGVLSLDEALEAVRRAAADTAIVVPLGERTYRVEIGAGARGALDARVGDASSVVVVTDATVAPLWGNAAADALQDAGYRVIRVVLEAGEQAKHVGSAQRIWDTALAAGIDRRAMVVGVGGGVVGDLAGFAAATLLRGIRVGHVPTTLLSMVDSSIGGKTGFDTAAGKNLVGAFHQPSFVLADVDALATLPIEERRAGLAEVVKSAWLEGEAEVAQLERDAEALVEGDAEATERAIRMSCRLKSRVVTEDEREAGVRALLNLGHTVGHAIEASRGYQGIRHGEAVSLGIVAACRLATALGRQRAEAAERAQALLSRLGLPVDLDAYLDPEVAGFLTSDKKMDGTDLKFVVPSDPGDVAVVPLPVSQVTDLVWRR